MELIYVKPNKCLGCKSCEIACRITQGKEELIVAISKSPLPSRRLFVEQQGEINLPVLCHHCEDAPCITACITGCLYKDVRGFVRSHKERCIGCWSCIMACPFGVITPDTELHLAVKCDRCYTQEIPACVDACPTHALMLIETDSFPKEQRKALLLRGNLQNG
jgi:anaerobic carbon-monoxide dehydrogenase iron sulfur subunit